MAWKDLVADSFSDAGTLSRRNISMHGGEIASSGELNVSRKYVSSMQDDTHLGGSSAQLCGMRI